MPSDYLLSCIEDGAGFLWIATQNGLSRFNLLKGTFQNFDAADGLPQEAFAEASCTSTKDGELVFGTLNGYIRFNPSRIVNRKIRANIAFTNLQVNSEEVIPGEAGSPLKYAVNSSKEITLTYNQNVISIDYALLDYRSEEKESYAYRLIGFDSAWRNNKSERRAAYTNLTPGEYLFQVKATSADLYMDTPVKSLTITILPPPWKTWWAYLIYVALGILLLAVIRKYALAMLKLRQRIIIERELADLRLSFFTNVSHELRTPLTLILNPLEEIAKQEKLSAQGSRHLDLVRKNAQRMTRFVNQLLDLRKAQSGKSTLRVSHVELVSFIRRITGYFADVADQKKINLSVAAEAEPIFGWIDAEKMDVVIYNVLGNAFKFTPPGRNIRISIGHSKSNGNIVIEITDEGTGVPDSELSDIFSLYFEGQHQEGSSAKGTGIGLALSKELIQLHHGQISARNNQPQGLSVKLELKPGETHFEKDRVVFTDAVPDYEEVVTGELIPNDEAEPVEEKANEADGLPQLLLVEDNSELRYFLKNQLSGLYRVETAANGEEGLQKATALLPDVVLSDVMMPIMNGIKMLDKLKNNPATSHIPVVLLSAKFSIESQIEGLKYGADYYIAKPFQNEFLIASLKNLVIQRKRLFESLLKDKKVMNVNPTPIAITSHDELFLQKVIEIVEEKMSDMEFNIEVVAESMNMSRSPFYKKLKSLTGLSPIEFVREIRLKRSLQYLNAGEHNISLIAFEVGFNSAKYFSTCFKQRFGQTPSDYVKSNVKTAT